jgi:hypothetical protein
LAQGGPFALGRYSGAHSTSRHDLPLPWQNGLHVQALHAPGGEDIKPVADRSRSPVRTARPVGSSS